MKYFVYTSPHDVIEYNHRSRDLDVATDSFLASRNHDPALVEFDCISDHVNMCFVDDATLYIVCRDAQSTLALADMFH